jgi:hypothetical protein
MGRPRSSGSGCKPTRGSLMPTSSTEIAYDGCDSRFSGANILSRKRVCWLCSVCLCTAAVCPSLFRMHTCAISHAYMLV